MEHKCNNTQCQHTWNSNNPKPRSCPKCRRVTWNKKIKRYDFTTLSLQILSIISRKKISKQSQLQERLRKTQPEISLGFNPLKKSNLINKSHTYYINKNILLTHYFDYLIEKHKERTGKEKPLTNKKDIPKNIQKIYEENKKRIEKELDYKNNFDINNLNNDVKEIIIKDLIYHLGLIYEGKIIQTFDELFETFSLSILNSIIFNKKKIDKELYLFFDFLSNIYLNTDPCYNLLNYINN